MFHKNVFTLDLILDKQVHLKINTYEYAVVFDVAVAYNSGY